eukprot:GILK01009379.1.p1 GENE.GILK01009379.1~~GILK01009379.1.p1  ORF type:complete len:1014 (-),score=246.46 GILK01009379.1:143-3184(-)
MDASSSSSDASHINRLLSEQKRELDRIRKQSDRLSSEMDESMRIMSRSLAHVGTSSSSSGMAPASPPRTEWRQQTAEDPARSQWLRDNAEHAAKIQELEARFQRISHEVLTSSQTSTSSVPPPSHPSHPSHPSLYDQPVSTISTALQGISSMSSSQKQALQTTDSSIVLTLEKELAHAVDILQGERDRQYHESMALQSEIEKLRRTNESLEQQLNNRTSRASERDEAHRNEMQDLLKRWSDERTAMDTQLQDLTRRLQSVMQEKESMAQRFDNDRERSRTEYLSNVQQLTSTVRTLQTEKQDVTESFMKEKEQRERLERELDRLQGRFTEMDSQLNRVMEEQRNRSSVEGQKEMHLASIESTLYESRTALETERHKVSELNTLISSQNIEIEKLRAQLDVSKRVNSALNLQIAEESASWKHKFQMMEESNEKLRKEIHELSTNLVTGNRSLDSAKQSLDEEKMHLRSEYDLQIRRLEERLRLVEIEKRQSEMQFQRQREEIETRCSMLEADLSRRITLTRLNDTEYQSLRNQITDLTNQLESVMRDKTLRGESWSKDRQQYESKIEELEDQLHQIRTEQLRSSVYSKSKDSIQTGAMVEISLGELNHYQTEIRNLQKQLRDTETRYHQVDNRDSEMRQLIHELRSSQELADSTPVHHGSEMPEQPVPAATSLTGADIATLQADLSALKSWKAEMEPFIATLESRLSKQIMYNVEMQSTLERLLTDKHDLIRQIESHHLEPIIEADDKVSAETLEKNENVDSDGLNQELNQSRAGNMLAGGTLDNFVREDYFRSPAKSNQRSGQDLDQEYKRQESVMKRLKARIESQKREAEESSMFKRIHTPGSIQQRPSSAPSSRAKSSSSSTAKKVKKADSSVDSAHAASSRHHQDLKNLVERRHRLHVEESPIIGACLQERAEKLLGDKKKKKVGKVKKVSKIVGEPIQQHGGISEKPIKRKVGGTGPRARTPTPLSRPHACPTNPAQTCSKHCPCSAVRSVSAPRVRPKSAQLRNIYGL